MASLQNSPSFCYTLSPNSFPQIGLQRYYDSFPCCRKGISFVVRAEHSLPNLTSLSQVRPGRRQLVAVSLVAPWVSLVNQTSPSFAAETKKGFLLVTDKKDGYSFLYPFGWQEVFIEGQDKVFKDIIEPLENVSVTTVPTSKQDIRDFGPPQQVAEVLIKKVLAPPSQKTKLIEASEHDVDGKTYYTFEFTARAPNYTRHALSTISIGNGKFYTLTTGANERRWDKMKDKLHEITDSFKIFNV
ncbi:psbP-like protein 1, chloroplastic [Ricinus communis]|uniref:Thylakoid lumenal 25.6 kDa protein, chloroplast, putative n=1 Tax=Ricinus communis TaxID=3988 RepID=B9T155_RICCO|nr:psbP-like protein 1, chloroplastic [Ricinus communis]EEF30409.1 Thylakoid lumenal 25.6 kDa protein, chloroplast precursor, putative [Ricinus communis]|eukprot:XP_002531973.1 psbP-like protein 1, chloroplastic [Ricinus communis]